MSSNKVQLSKLKALISKSLSGNGGYRRYSSEVKQLVRQLFEQGLSIQELSQATGITGNSIRKWMDTESHYEDERPFHQILVAGDKTYEVVLPNGVRIGGLSFEEVLKMATHAAA